MGFDAGTLAQVSLGSQGVGAVMQTFGAYSAASSQRAGLRYGAQVARNNAQIAEWQAEDALARGRTNEQNQRLKTAALKGPQRAGLPARGFDLGEGTPLAILSDTDFMGDRDALAVRDAGKKDAWAQRMRAQNYMADAAGNEFAASGINPFLAASSTLLTGAGNVASSWYKMNQSGALKGTPFEMKG